MIGSLARSVGRRILRLGRRLSVRVVGMAVLALAGTAVAPLLSGVIPAELSERFGRDAVLPVLDILASSMLAVTTFSLATMVQAFHTASGQATPRAFRVLVQDRTTQNVLGTFVGSFLFALTAITMYRAGYYSAESSVVIALLTGLTIAAIIFAILRWIAHLSRLGSMDHTLDMVEQAAAGSLRDTAREPGFGALATGEAAPSGAVAVPSPTTGYMASIDVPALDTAMEGVDGTLWLLRRPGDFVLEGETIARADRDPPTSAIHDAMVISNVREQEQDPRFGLMVLAEIGARALSPGVNDPGTAIDVVKRQTRLLWDHARTGRNDPDHRTDRVRIAPQDAGELVSSAFDVIIRDGAGRIEVVDALLQALGHLAGCGRADLRDAAREKHAYAAGHARDAIDHPDDRARLERRADEL